MGASHLPANRSAAVTPMETPSGRTHGVVTSLKRLEAAPLLLAPVLDRKARKVPLRLPLSSAQRSSAVPVPGPRPPPGTNVFLDRKAIRRLVGGVTTTWVLKAASKQ